jgi:hypothetical protein
MALKVMSWNIQKLDPKKANSDEFLRYLSLVINHYQADVVGVMEVTADTANNWYLRLAAELSKIQTLKFKTKISWNAVISEQQLVSPYEAYVYLYRDQTHAGETLEPHPGLGSAFTSTGVLEDEIFKKQFADNKLSNDQQDEFWQMLSLLGYLDQFYTVPNKCLDRLSSPAELNFNAAPDGSDFSGLLPNSKKEIKTILLAKCLDPYLRLPSSRPAFIGVFQLTSKSKVKKLFPITMFHAPGPGNLWRYVAVNNLAYVTTVSGDVIDQSNNSLQWENGLVMGDFNIDDNDRRVKHAEVALFDEKGQQVKNNNDEKLFVKAFQTIEYRGYAKTMNGQPTSLLAAEPSPNQVFPSLRSKTYDNFFVKTEYVDPANSSNNKAATITYTGNAWVLPLISNSCLYDMSQQTTINPVPANAEYIADIATAAVLYSKCRETLPPAFPANNVATDTTTAWGMYTKDVSDHLPIMIELNV